MQNNVQEHQLKLAVENILQDAEVNACQNTAEDDSIGTPGKSFHFLTFYHTPSVGSSSIFKTECMINWNFFLLDGSLIVSRFGDTPGSVPRLNVGLWKPQETLTELEDYRKVDFSPTDSIIIAPPPPALSSIGDAHHEINERETALRSLVQRINDERQSLLSSRRQPVFFTATEDKDDDIRNLEEKVLQQRKQLKIQQSEVKRLGDSIAAPECMNTPLENDEAKSSPHTSGTHESIIVENSDVSLNSSSHSLLPEKHVKKKGKISEEDGSFLKDSLFYSMDVSMSSVIMDRTESSSSGSKSLSLHGVQVLVKVCGAEEDSRAMSYFDGKNGRAKITELTSGSESQADGAEDVSIRPETSISVKTSVKQVDKNVRPKKVKRQPVSKKPKEKESQVLSEKAEKASQRNHRFQPLSDQEMKSKPEILPMKVTKDGNKKKTRKKSTRCGSEMIKNTSEEVKVGKKTAERSEINVAEMTPQHSQEDSEVREHLTSTSTSYLSPPDKVLSSLTEDIKTLMALAQRKILPQSGTSKNHESSQISHDGPLVSYINRLLAMSRESIDRLNISCSEVSTPSSALFKSSSVDNAADFSVITAPTEKNGLQSRILNQDDADDTANFHESVNDESKRNMGNTEPDEWLLHSALTDQGALTDMTRQCHEKILALTKMIEEVRRQAVVTSSTEGDSNLSADNQSKSTLHLDSTAYMSPPPHVLEWTDFSAPALLGNDTKMSLDPYSNAVVQLLEDVRSHMSSKGTELPDPLIASPFRAPALDSSNDVSGRLESNQTRPKPPVAFWRNIER